MVRRNHKGFSLVEVIVVLAIIGVMLTVAGINWQKYQANTALRSAARDIVSDIQDCKAKATSESRRYLVAFATGPNGYYWIWGFATSSYTFVFKQKYFSQYGNGIKVSSISGNVFSNAVQIEARGITSICTINLTNSLGSTATIRTNITGKTYVTFNIK